MRDLREIGPGAVICPVVNNGDFSSFRFSHDSTTLTCNRHWGAEGSLQRSRAGRSGLHAVEDFPASAAGKFDGRAGVERKIAAGREFGDAVNQRPRNPSQRQRIASREIPGLLFGGDALL